MNIERPLTPEQHHLLDNVRDSITEVLNTLIDDKGTDFDVLSACQVVGKLFETTLLRASPDDKVRVTMAMHWVDLFMDRIGTIKLVDLNGESFTDSVRNVALYKAVDAEGQGSGN